MRKVLFINHYNSGRTQMAEGLVNHFLKEEWQAFSAGIECTELKPYAVEAMKQIGIDISRQFSKTLLSLQDNDFDLIIDLCDESRESCPFFPSCDIIHQAFVDPTNIGLSPQEKLDAFCYIRDRIHEWIVPYLMNYPNQ